VDGELIVAFWTTGATKTSVLAKKYYAQPRENSQECV